MPKNLLILGGYNWVGFELIDKLIMENSFTDFIIVDCFENQLWKDDIKAKMDTYRYLYEENIFLYNYNIKEKDKIKELYTYHNITHVVNNIKYNRRDQHIMDKIDGLKTIVECNKRHAIQCYICLHRSISHNTICFNHDKQDHVSICNDFNHCVRTMNQDSASMAYHELRIVDYVYGEKKDKYNEIIQLYKNIIRSGAPCYIENCSFYIQKDEAILTHVLDLLLKRKTKPIACHTYRYQELVETIQYYMSSKQEIKDKIKHKHIHDNTELIQYIQS